MGPRPLLLATGGLIASGKSTVAQAIAREYRARLIVADTIRESKLAPARRTEQGASETWLGSFDLDFTRELYADLLTRVEDALDADEPVVADACFWRSSLRRELAALARRRGASLLFVECRASRPELTRRLRERAQASHMSSSDWIALLDEFTRHWQPVRELSSEQHLVLDTDGPLERNLRFVRERVRALAEGKAPVTTGGELAAG